MKLSAYLTLSSREAGPKEPDDDDDFGVNVPGDEDDGPVAIKHEFSKGTQKR